MRVGIDLSPLWYGNQRRGIGIYAENLVRGLAATDTTTQYTLYVPSGAGSVEWLPTHAGNFQVRRVMTLPLGRARAVVSHQLALPLAARADGLDVLHALAVPFNPSHPGIPYWQSVPTVVTCFDLIPLQVPAMLAPSRYRRFYEFQLAACRRAAHVITSSEATARGLAEMGIAPREKLTVVPLAPPPPDTTHSASPEMAALAQGAPFLLHVGGDEPYKNQETVLRAFGKLCANPSFQHRLVLAGKSHLADDAALAESTNAALRIVRVTPESRADMDVLFEACDALIYPSLEEGFGLPVLEAMRAGAPVVTSNCSSLPEVSGNAALLVNPKDANEVVAAVRRVLNDERLRIELSEAGKRRAAEFSWELVAERTRAVYRQIADGRWQMERLDEG